MFGEPLASALASSPGGEYGPSRSKRTKNNAKPEAWYALNKLLAPMARHSLVRRDSKARTYSVHRLVQAVLRDELAAAHRKEIAERAVKALNWTFPRALAIREAMLGPDHADTSTGLNDLATVLQAQGRTAEAEPLFRRALAIYEAALGPEHPRTVTCQWDLATLLSRPDRGRVRPTGTKRGQLMSVNWWIEKGTRLLSRFVHGDSTS